jgi:hypothetical protein
MSRRLLVWVFCLMSAGGCARTPAAQCRAADVQGVQVISTKPLHPSKHWRRYRIAEELLLEFRYDSLASTVAVRTVQAPHYPWTMSEAVLDSTVVRMTGAPSKGESSMGTASLTIACQELQGD